ncbi:MAG TPA: sigma-70 family RNA polymerase sigma factor [Acidimicrobiales bacterium]|nr:sigma-70 family RNA polymerase sigma factor [Acidimicrobiales bacterium]
MTGNEEFERWFRSLYPRAYGIALRIVGSPAEAEDAAAEAFSRALLRWRRVGELDYRDAWLLRVTANVAIDVVRHRKRAPAVTPVVEEPAGDTADRLYLLGALATLPARQRDVLVLRYFADLTDEDIARCLSLAAGTVKSHVHRGLVRMRRRLADAGEEVPLALDAH